jgi:hypothetical protein
VTLEGEGRLNLLYYDEIYTFTFPVVYARGILWGTLVMELAGDICVKCEQSGYRTDIEFKVKVRLCLLQTEYQLQIQWMATQKQ